jgi:lysophospholipase L1-like esterase
VGRVTAALAHADRLSPLCRGLVRAGRAGDRTGVHSAWLDLEPVDGGPVRRVDWTVGDLTGDGRPETVVRIWGGGDYPVCEAVLSPSGGRLEVVRVLDDRTPPARAAGLSSRGVMPGLALADGALVERVPLYGADDPMCCPHSLLLRRLRWDGERLVPGDRTITAPDPVAEPWPRARAAGGRLLRPTPGRPLRVLFAGDSLSTGPAVYFERWGDGTGAVSTFLDNRGSSGLVRPDFLNWPRRLAADIAADDPHVVVFMLGANDDQGLVIGGVARHAEDPLWQEEYRRRVAVIMRLATRGGRLLVWVGMPPMRPSEYGRAIATIDRIAASEARLHPGVSYVDPAESVGTSEGGFAATLPDRSGRQVAMRAPDGIHLSAAGADRVAGQVVGALGALLPLPRASR